MQKLIRPGVEARLFPRHGHDAQMQIHYCREHGFIVKSNAEDKTVLFVKPKQNLFTASRIVGPARFDKPFLL